MKRVLFLAMAVMLLSCSVRDTGKRIADPPADGKEMTVRKLSQEVDDPASVPELFSKEGIEYQSISTINFGQSYPVVPKVSFAVAYTDNNIVIHYKVSEPSVRAVANADCQRVWEDSCCEFFSTPVKDGYYYNLEANCTGTILIEGGSVKSPREYAPEEVLQSVKRWSSLGRESFETKEEPTEWEMALIVPFRTFYFKHHVKSLKGRTIRANFYKCGDLLPVPHHLSWSPIHPPATHFHCPDFFGTLRFK